MGSPARPLHEPGNHRSAERCSHRHSADCGSLTEQPTAAQDSRSYTTAWGRICENAQEPARRRIVFSITLLPIAVTALFVFRLTKSRRTFYAQTECLCFHTAWSVIEPAPQVIAAGWSGSLPAHKFVVGQKVWFTPMSEVLTLEGFHHPVIVIDFQVVL